MKRNQTAKEPREPLEKIAQNKKEKQHGIILWQKNYILLEHKKKRKNKYVNKNCENCSQRWAVSNKDSYDIQLVHE